MNATVALSRLRLYAEIPGDDKRLYVMTFGVYNKTMRVYINRVVKNEVGGARDYLFGMAIVPLSLATIASELTKLHTHKEEYDFTLSLFSPRWEDNKRVPDSKELTGMVKLVKEKIGSDMINSICILDKEGTAYRFPLLPTPFVEMTVNGKKVTDKTTLSAIWLDTYSRTFNAVMGIIPEALVENK